MGIPSLATRVSALNTPTTAEDEWKMTFDESKMPEITAWKLARQALEHENLLINNRFTWLFQAQAFLFASFFLAITNLDKFPNYSKAGGSPVGSMLMFVIAALAVYVCLVTHTSVGLANEELDRITDQYDKLRKQYTSPLVPPLHNRDRRNMRPFDQRTLPIVATILWIGAMFVYSLLDPSPWHPIEVGGVVIAASYVFYKLRMPV